MQTENPFAAPESPAEIPLPSLSDRQKHPARIAAPRWWLCTWLGTAVAGALYGAVSGLTGGIEVAIFIGGWGFVFAFSIGFVVSTIGLLPLLLLRSLLTHRWFPLTLAVACGGTSGQVCIGWLAACVGAVGAVLSVVCFGWPRSIPSSN